MSITRQNPNTILLSNKSDSVTIVNDVPCSEAITPGMLIERHSSSGEKWRKNANAGDPAAKAVALNASMLNKGIDDAYSSGDLIEAAILPPGATAYMLLASGENVAVGDQLESNGDGTLVKVSSGTPLFVVVYAAVNNAVGPTTARVRAEAL